MEHRVAVLLRRVLAGVHQQPVRLFEVRWRWNATRSLLNTAKVMEDNPTVLRLKELETLEKVTEKVGNITVYGGLDGVLDQLVRIQR